MKWEIDALKMLARNSTVPGIALADVIADYEKLKIANLNLSQLVNITAARVDELFADNAEMMAALFFHPRAAKLMRKRKNFVAIAEDEPYFIRAYSLIRENEIIKGTWSDTDEGLFQEALAKVERADVEFEKETAAWEAASDEDSLKFENQLPDNPSAHGFTVNATVQEVNRPSILLCEDDFNAAQDEVNRLMMFLNNLPEAKKIDELNDLIDDYEEEHYPIPAPSRWEWIKHHFGRLWDNYWSTFK